MTQVQMTHVSHFEHWDFGFICDLVLGYLEFSKHGVSYLLVLVKN